MNAPLTELDLTRIDPTRDTTPDPASPAAEALLARVLATPRTPEDLTSRTTTATGRRSARLRRRWVLVGASAAVTAAGLVAAQVVSDQGTPQAFASWTPDPTPLTAAEAASWEADCLAVASRRPPGDDTPAPGPQIAGVAETRGLFTAMVAVTPQGVASCLSSDPRTRPGVPLDRIGPSAWSPSDNLAAPPEDGVTVGGGLSSRDEGGTFTLVMGRAGAAVTGVVVTDDRGQRVAATLGSGYFVAWWPAWSTGSLTVRTTLADGRTTERVLQRGEH
ncbi:hypothetical protein SAMN06264364_12081 [Quadrisphaera granulorum]|uniref:Uncharacterized protein n=1 Tax=Quadrisphaera granulorum TaxID=317664 RepID=A0A316A2I6_9ACTN|nr:hypothetical protein [Quadrisphaera granulorum]PWJ51803.1 hypothetical protein BXY45_12081 [Quadrisphaera granulorum]SZE97750.1 hypothetical protein SAMN06264364_12081 [Quadrisphaera granulorum]